MHIAGKLGLVKTTIDLPENLVRAAKIRAVNEGRRLKDVMADAIATGLARSEELDGQLGARPQLPLIECAHGARPLEEVTPDRAAEILLDDERRSQPTA